MASTRRTQHLSIHSFGLRKSLWENLVRFLPKKLTMKQASGIVHFSRAGARERQSRACPRRLAIFAGFAFMFIFISACLTSHISGSKTSATISQKAPSQPQRVKRQIYLRKPPSMTSFLPATHGDRQKITFPHDHLIPFVYTAVGIPYKNHHTNNSELLLFLYTQGTLACTGEHAKPCSYLDVTSCLVGDDSFPVLYDANGVYTCSITRGLVEGEPLTVMVSAHVWKRKLDTAEDGIVEGHLKSMRRLDTGAYVLTSDTRWEDQTDKPVGGREGRYRVCLMTQEKHFPDYIPEWLTYHRRIGVDYVYIYDNNSPKNMSNLFKAANDVEVVYWPWERSQIQAQNHFLLVGRRRCQWGIFIDVDEFLIVRSGRYESGNVLPLKALLRDMREKKDVSQIRVKSIVLGSSGHIYHPREAIVESYWHLARNQDRLTKPIAWLGHVMPDSTVHRIETSDGYYTALSKDFLNGEGEIESVGLCHYKFKSWEDYVEKGRGGRNSFHVGTWDYSANWSIHEPSKGHLSLKNGEKYTECRRIWRRTLGMKVLEPELGGWDEAERRYARTKKEGWVWKRRRGLVEKENVTVIAILIEHERAFHKLKEWEIAKRDRLSQWNKTVDFLT